MRPSSPVVHQIGTGISRFAYRLGMLAAASLIPAVVHSNAATVRTVTLTDQPAPGTASGTMYRDINPFYFALNDSGHVAFVGYLTGNGVDGLNNEGIWSEGSSNLELVARKGSHAPGTNFDVKLFEFYSPVLNNAGHTLFGAGLTDGTFIPNGQGIWSQRVGGLTLVARDGTQAPGADDGVNFTGFGGSLLNGSGKTAFRAKLAGGGVDGTNNEGVWSEGAGTLGIVARAGSQAPGTPSGVQFDLFGLPAMNDAGHTAFHGYVAGSGVDLFTNNDGIWSGASGSLVLVARSGSQAPGAPSGVNFAGFLDPALNNAGHIAFWGHVDGSDLGGAFDDGIWSEGSGSLALVARRGSQAPGAPNGVMFGTTEIVSFDRPVLSDSGDVAFRGFVSGAGVDETNNDGIWAGRAEALTLVARTGSQAPGTADGVSFSSFFPWSGPLQLNETGQAAFTGYLTGSGVTPFENDRGVWATDRTGALRLIARTGDILEVAPGDFRMIQELSLGGEATGGSDGHSSSINSGGQIAFWARLIDGSEGIFVSDAVAVPESSSLLFAVVAATGAIWRRRRSTL